MVTNVATGTLDVDYDWWVDWDKDGATDRSILAETGRNTPRVLPITAAIVMGHLRGAKSLST